MGARYSENEITRMVEQYAALRAQADTKPGRKLDTLVRLADLDKALDRLPMDLWRVVLVHGLLGVTRDESARVLQISTGAVSKRFRLAIEELHYDMNGGT
jgi:DNA-directed RNA polymerase specialized sigma24 family protein